MTPRFPFHVLENKSVSFDTKLHRRFYFGKCTVKGWANRSYSLRGGLGFLYEYEILKRCEDSLLNIRHRFRYHFFSLNEKENWLDSMVKVRIQRLNFLFCYKQMFIKIRTSLYTGTLCTTIK